jgi:hypothetical protein
MTNIISNCLKRKNQTIVNYFVKEKLLKEIPFHKDIISHTKSHHLKREKNKLLIKFVKKIKKEKPYFLLAKIRVQNDFWHSPSEIP